MGGNCRQKKSTGSSNSFSVFNLFKFRRPGRSTGDDNNYMDDHVPSTRSRVFPTDNERRLSVADPSIDRKAQDFIDRIHRNMATPTNSERKTNSIIHNTSTTTTNAVTTSTSASPKA